MSGPLLSSINSGLFFYFVYVFFLPGTILWFFRSLFVVGRPEKLSEHFLIFITLSALYAMLLGLPLQIVLDLNSGPFYRYVTWVAYVVVIPAIFGTSIGVATQAKLLGRIFLLFKLQIKTPHLTGWDWVFGQLKEPIFMLITLQDGSKIYGFFGEKSLASSDPEERNLFLEEVWDFNEGANQWQPLKEKRGILISGDSIRHIEVWKFLEQANDQSA